MSHYYPVKGFPVTHEQCRATVDQLVQLYPDVELRRWAQRQETKEEASIAAAYHDHVIDDAEMSALYDYVIDGVAVVDNPTNRAEAVKLGLI